MIDERMRHELFLRLENVLGPEEAATLMEHLPPVGWADVATKHDLESQRVLMKQDLDLLRADMNHEFASVRSEMRQEFALVRAELGGEIAGIRTELGGEISGIRVELAGIRNESVTPAMLQAEVNRLLLWLFPTLLTALALVFAVAKLS